MNKSAQAKLDLPAGITTCLFDLDGVITKTSALHARAWKQAFDEFLVHWRPKSGRGSDCSPFNLTDDYARYVDGKPRADGVRDFLASRNISLPEGDHDDAPQTVTVHGLGNHKNELVLQLLHESGIETYEGSVAYVGAARDLGMRTGLVSSSANAAEVLAAAGLSDLFEVRVDGVVARELGLPGKPAPDTFLHAATVLGVEPAQAVVFEDAVAGVGAARLGGFGYVVGVDRLDQAAELRTAGADIVVNDLGDLLA